MAVIVILAMLVLNSNISKNAAGVNQANTLAQSLQAEMAGVNDGLRINQDLIFENRDAITSLAAQINDIRQTQIRVDLSSRSDALKELAPSLPADISNRVLNISKGLNSLASLI